jgi:hypothetical protein
LTLSNRQIEYSNCRTLPIESYQYVNESGKESNAWRHKGEDEMLFGRYIDGTYPKGTYPGLPHLCLKLKVTFKDGSFCYVTKK